MTICPSAQVSAVLGALLPLGVLGGAALVVNINVVAPAQAPVFRSGVKFVPVYATVRDGSGRLVPNLGRDEFRVFDNGRAVEITVFSSDPQPLSVAIMLDASASGGPRGRDTSRSAANLHDSVLAFVRALGPNDRASLGTFGTEIAVGANLTNDVAEFERVLREEYWTGPGAGTPLWQAIDAAMASLSRQPNRRVVLVFTDGYDSGPLPHWKGSRSTVLKEVLNQDGMLYVVRPAWIGERQRPLPTALVTFTQSAGGGYFEVAEDDDLEVAFARVSEELRHQYLLGFAPTALDGKEHNIEVQLARPGLKAYSRQKYMAIP